MNHFFSEIKEENKRRIEASGAFGEEDDLKAELSGIIKEVEQIESSLHSQSVFEGLKYAASLDIKSLLETVRKKIVSRT